ncbi:MAG: uncharacterized protein A8A55_1586 [Amphiamblys sp. WSBS2006]|nr:MAG: uncharacterized protein A8A55_1586 [Amphiamblys sp. WSBS2006]
MGRRLLVYGLQPSATKESLVSLLGPETQLKEIKFVHGDETRKTPSRAYIETEEDAETVKTKIEENSMLEEKGTVEDAPWQGALSRPSVKNTRENTLGTDEEFRFFVDMLKTNPGRAFSASMKTADRTPKGTHVKTFTTQKRREMLQEEEKLRTLKERQNTAHAEQP